MARMTDQPSLTPFVKRVVNRKDHVGQINATQTRVMEMLSIKAVDAVDDYITAVEPWTQRYGTDLAYEALASAVKVRASTDKEALRLRDKLCQVDYDPAASHTGGVLDSPEIADDDDDDDEEEEQEQEEDQDEEDVTPRRTRVTNTKTNNRAAADESVEAVKASGKKSPRRFRKRKANSDPFGSKTPAKKGGAEIFIRRSGRK